MSESQSSMDVEDLTSSLDRHIDLLEEGHRMHRKIKFLLDIRGLLIINKLQGDYVEFGVYRGEMMYAAGKILAPHIRKYIGLDTFTGLPEPIAGDQDRFVFETPGFMSAPLETAKRLMKDHETVLIRGDFRDEEPKRRLANEAGPISVLSLDCNWPSSVEAALLGSCPLLQSGSIVYFDDYFVGTREPNFNRLLLDRATEEYGLVFEEFMTYPPCGRAFLVEKQ